MLYSQYEIFIDDKSVESTTWFCVLGRNFAAKRDCMKGWIKRLNDVAEIIGSKLRFDEKY